MSDLKRKDLSPLVVNTIFISSTAHDLREFRQAVAWIQQERFGVTESFPDREWNSATTPDKIVAECRRRVVSADAFILILGPWAGWIPPGYTESITHLEFQWARVHFAKLCESIREFAKKSHAPELMRFYTPRILVLTAGPHDLGRDRSDGGPASLRIEDQVRQLLAERTKAELEEIKISLRRFHREVSEAADVHEATLYSFNDMEDMQVEVLNMLRRWQEFGAECVRLLH